jgi:hypothetical protein
MLIMALIAYSVYPVGSLGVDIYYNFTESAVYPGLLQRWPSMVTPWATPSATSYDSMMFLLVAIDTFARLWDKCSGVEWASYPSGLSSANCTAALGSWVDQRWLLNRILQSTKGYVGATGPVWVIIPFVSLCPLKSHISFALPSSIGRERELP